MTVGGAAAAAELPQCPVCYDTLGRCGGPATLPCGHNGCLDCFRLVQNRNAMCPLCRQVFGRELNLSVNHELEDLIRLATMLFVDEGTQADGWEAFPSTQLTADSYAAELLRGHQRAAAAAAAAKGPAGHAPPPRQSAAQPAGAASAAGGLMGSVMDGLSALGFGGGGGGGGLEDLHDIMTRDPAAEQREQEWEREQQRGAAGRQGQPPRHSRGGGGGAGGYEDWMSSAPSAPPALYDDLDDGTASVSGRSIHSAAPWFHGSVRHHGHAPHAPHHGSGGGSAVLALEPPLWLPDSHAHDCLSCHLPFRPFTRLRHHCRLCGKIFCAACCHKRALLPPKYGCRTPQRVCELCAAALAPAQQLLAGTLAAAAQPPVQDSPDAISLRAWLNAPWTSGLEQDIFKAANMLSSFVKAVHMSPESGLPTAALRGAAGLACLTVAKLGAGWSLTVGTGLVVARTPDGGWSAPCALSCFGIGWGLQLGGELADVLLVLRSREAVSGLCGGLRTGLAVGCAAGASVGPMGRRGEAAVVLNALGSAGVVGYSCAKGAFAGLALEGSLLCVRDQMNLNFYGYDATPRQLLLEGTVPPPPAAAMLYEGIKALLHRFECRGSFVHTRGSSAPQLRAPPPRAAAATAAPPQPQPSPQLPRSMSLPLAPLAAPSRAAAGAAGPSNAAAAAHSAAPPQPAASVSGGAAAAGACRGERSAGEDEGAGCGVERSGDSGSSFGGGFGFGGGGASGFGLSASGIMGSLMRQGVGLAGGDWATAPAMRE